MPTGERTLGQQQDYVTTFGLNNRFVTFCLSKVEQVSVAYDVIDIQFVFLFHYYFAPGRGSEVL